MKVKGYSIWLMPTGEAYDKFASIIKQLAKQYSAPLFQPHITLLGEIIGSEEEIIERTQQLASVQKSFRITLQALDYQDYYFRTLFVKAKLNKSLQTLHNRAKELFNMQDIPQYMPHLSLLYGNFSQSVKNKIIETIGRDFSEQFIVDKIHLFKTDGEVGSWYKVQLYTFCVASKLNSS